MAEPIFAAAIEKAKQMQQARLEQRREAARIEAAQQDAATGFIDETATPLLQRAVAECRTSGITAIVEQGPMSVDRAMPQQVSFRCVGTVSFASGRSVTDAKGDPLVIRHDGKHCTVSTPIDGKLYDTTPSDFQKSVVAGVAQAIDSFYQDAERKRAKRMQ